MAHRASECEERGGDLSDVLLLVEVNCLEDVQFRHAVRLEGLLEPAKDSNKSLKDTHREASNQLRRRVGADSSRIFMLTKLRATLFL